MFLEVLSMQQQTALNDESLDLAENEGLKTELKSQNHLPRCGGQGGRAQAEALQGAWHRGAPHSGWSLGRQVRTLCSWKGWAGSGGQHISVYGNDQASYAIINLHRSLVI